MRLAQKLAKAVDPRARRSARQYIARVLRPRRFGLGSPARRIIASIDRERFEAIREQHALDDPGRRWPKYLDLEKWIAINLRRVRELELDFGNRKDILDLGSGAGYFLYICKWLGHRPLGVDIDEVPMYPEMTRLLGLERIVWRVEAFKPLPQLGRKFDLITAFMVCFNNHNRAGLWGVREWDFFLNDIAHHLKPHGRGWLELNRQRDGTFMTEELARFFQSRGARLERHRIIFDAPPVLA